MERIEKLVAEIKQLRTELFGKQSEEVYNQLGRAMAALIRAKEALK